MKILITGVTGYIGRSLVKRLSNKEDMEIIGTSRKRTDTDFKTFKTDLLDKEILKIITKDVDVVIHLAFESKMFSEKKMGELNLKMTKNLIEASKDNNVKNFIFTSSYDVITAPNSYYSKYKLESERLIEESFKRYTIVRPNILVGAKEGGDYKDLIEKIKSKKGGGIIFLKSHNHKITIVEMKDVLDVLEKRKQGIATLPRKEMISKDFIEHLRQENNEECDIFYIPTPKIILLIKNILKKLIK